MELNEPVYEALYDFTKALSVAMGYRDPLTRLHSDRVRNISEAIGIAYGLPGPELAILRIAASFHDIGKLGIPDHILMKPGRLDQTERERMNLHAEIGEKIIAAIDLDGSLEASIIVRHHHARYDGQGYPDHLHGEGIPICSRIISIADSYDAMAVTRPYHIGKSHTEIMQVLNQESGKKHDPELLRIFCEVIESDKVKVTAT